MVRAEATRMTVEDKSGNRGRVYILCNKERSFTYAHAHIHIEEEEGEEMMEKEEEDKSCSFYGSHRKHGY